MALNNRNVRIGSGGYGYTDELPEEKSVHSIVKTLNMWGSSAAQIFSEVSPEMHSDFALKYEKKWLSRFGLNYYGCCEPLGKKIDILETIPNLRKISISPWNEFETTAEAVGNKYVVSLKPNPAVLASREWNPEVVKADLKRILRIFKSHNCSIEIIMKDISTVRHQPFRLWDWARIAGNVIDELY